MFIETFALSIWVTTLTLKVTITNAVFLSVCWSQLFLSHALAQKLLLWSVSIFGQIQYGRPPKPIEFEVDQAMVIRLISLMSKLLKGPIS